MDFVNSLSITFDGYLGEDFREIWYKVVRIIKTEESRIGECEMIFSKKVY